MYDMQPLERCTKDEQDQAEEYTGVKRGREIAKRMWKNLKRKTATRQRERLNGMAESAVTIAHVEPMLNH